ncbi:MAG: T9SS type A sorting domain-containing protein [Bacteroidetes bacterium]|nr:MAG: T9SS type A sorting domain-containing protein [Bacteroidota bacterium]
MKLQYSISIVLCLSLITFEKIKCGSSSQLSKQQVYVSQNVRLFPTSFVQTEPLVARHPLNSSILFVTANTFDTTTGFQSEGIYSTTDGGQTWFGSDTCKGFLISSHKGNPGIAIDKNGNFILTRLSSSPGLYSHSSTNNGLSWTAMKKITDADLYKATLHSDGDASSSYYGRTYAVWTSLAAPPHKLTISYTDDGGGNWSALKEVNNPASGTIGKGGEAAILLNGVIVVCWARAVNSSPFIEDFIGTASSSNGGATWSVTENAFDVNGIAGMIPAKANLKTNGWPRIAADRSGSAYNTRVYIVTAQKGLSPAGNDPDIVLNRSIDSGKTWSAGIRVNQDALNNNKYQYFPAIHIDDGGGVNILYYDDQNTTSDSVGVFLSRSTNGGDSWMDFEVSDHNFKPAPIAGLSPGYQGDNISLTSSGNTLQAFWMDNSSGHYQIWTAKIDISTLDVKDDKQEFPSRIRLFQNYPNPFNPLTIINYQLAIDNFVSLKVHNMLGEEIATLVNEFQTSGFKSQVWDASGLPSGVYIYKLVVVGQDGILSYTDVKKMLLLR